MSFVPKPTVVIFEARWPRQGQVMASWRAFGPSYDERRKRDLESQGFVVTRCELTAN